MDIKEGRLLVHSHWFPRRREGRRENLNQAIVSELRIVENAVGKNARERTRQVLAPKSADIDEDLEVFSGGFMTLSNMPPLTSTHRANGSFRSFSTFRTQAELVWCNPTIGSAERTLPLQRWRKSYLLANRRYLYRRNSSCATYEKWLC
jgi:hypothetical protein